MFSSLIAAMCLWFASSPDATNRTPTDWISSLEQASQVTLRTYVEEEEAGEISLREYAYGDYKPDGFKLQVWTPQQSKAGRWTADKAAKLTTEAPPAHVVELCGEEVREKILLPSGEYQSFPAYNRLTPFRQAQRARWVELEVEKLRTEHPDLPAETRKALVDQAVDERMKEIDHVLATDPLKLDGVPMTLARKEEPCLTGSTLASFVGKGSSLASLRAKFEAATPQPPAEVNGIACSVYRVDAGRRSEILFFNPQLGVVLWETDRWEDPGHAPTDPPAHRRFHYCSWQVVPAATIATQPAATAKESVRPQ